jgi:hypothetical protein
MKWTIQTNLKSCGKKEERTVTVVGYGTSYSGIIDTREEPPPIIVTHA